MVHTYEVWVDIREYLGQSNNSYHDEAARYEIAAESREKANGLARDQAINEHPLGVEYDVRLTRVLK